MNIDITSFFFNSTIEGATATCAWGTSIGQSKSKECRIETDIMGVNDFLAGLVYKSKSDIENFDLTKGSKNREYLIRSIFDKVFVNERRVKDKSFIVVLARENTASHSGRLIISYPPYASYKNGDVYVSNDATIAEMFNVLECKQSGCWFSYDISVINQDELHFSCVIVNKDNNMVYKGKSSERSAEWASLIPDAEHRNFMINTFFSSASRQIIYYGAPGTGKSHRIKEQLKGVSKENIFRTTFHPDSDYSTFVGAYKPTRSKRPLYGLFGKETVRLNDGGDLSEDAITYEFIPQAFLNAYMQAYRKPNENVYLIIEEINRGNCAQIFGDLFQLLDRDENGVSEYTIKADADLKRFLEENLGKDSDAIKDGELCLPANLYIYATMNTSDQSLFPIDSAFKRRWDWEYEPIKYKNTDWEIEIGDLKYRWSDFQKEVNTRILKDTGSEDKMLGDYFVNPPTRIISYNLFRNKILFYLWNDVCKDGDADIFPTGEEFSFSKLYDEDSKQLIISIMDKLELKPIPINGGNTEDEEGDDLLEGEDNNSSSIRYSINGEETDEKGKIWGKGALVKRAVEIFCQNNPDLSAEEVRDRWISVGFKIPHVVETEDDKQKRLNGSTDKTGRERCKPIKLRNEEVVYVSTEVGNDKVYNNFEDFLSKIKSRPEWGIDIQEL